MDRAEFDAHFPALLRYARGAAYRAGFRNDLDDVACEILCALWSACQKCTEWPRWGYWRRPATQAIINYRRRAMALKRIPQDHLVRWTSETEIQASMQRRYVSSCRTKYRDRKDHSVGVTDAP